MDIRRLLSNHGNYSIHAIGRQANEAAHLIARHSRYLSCPKVFDVTPLFLSRCTNDICNDHYSNVILGSRGKALLKLDRDSISFLQKKKKKKLHQSFHFSHVQVQHENLVSIFLVLHVLLSPSFLPFLLFSS